MPKQIPDPYFSVKKLEKRSAAQDRVKSARAANARTDAKSPKAKLKRKR